MKRNKIYLVSLGCPKNRVDSETILGKMLGKSYALTTDPKEAEVIIVNTCAFLKSAVQESIDTILNLARYKKIGVLKKLIVAGCLPERYKKACGWGTGHPPAPRLRRAGKKRDLSPFPPEVDEFIGAREIATRLSTRLITTPPWTAYIKIAEGCNHKCSFCIIPKLRGPLRSRSVHSIREEVKRLLDQGVKEINLIAQDTTEYGADRRDGASIEKLLKSLASLPHDIWIRLMYAYPLRFSDELIEIIKDYDSICKYVDLPIQHVNDRILRSMLRGANSRYIHRLIERLRTKIPGITIRTTVLVGYPGETEKEFDELCDFVRNARFERLGVFKFSPEEESAAAGLPRQIPEKIKNEREKEIMLIQRKISLKKNRQLVGKEIRVLTEGATGRSDAHAPEIDGVIKIEGKKPSPGRFATAKITAASHYDLTGKII